MTPATTHNTEGDRGQPWYRRVPWTPIVVTIALIASGVYAVPPIHDAETGATIVEASLERPLGYVAIAPLSSVLDTLTLISARQHIALIVGALVLFIAWRVLRSRDAGARSHVVAAAGFVGTVVVVYAAGAMLPRPMARLVTGDANIVIADFHSHTDASHDGRQSVESNRRWHERAGFHVAWITDHGATAGAEHGIAANPATAAQGVMLLQSIEVTWNGEHVGILGAGRTYRGILVEHGRDVDPEALRLASLIPGREPVVIWHHPRQLDRLRAYAPPDTAGVSAIEIVNGAPRDIDHIARNRDGILALARQHDLALTSGSDNHGWGYAAPGWTLFRVLQYRALAADSLATRIERVLRVGGHGSTLVVKRRVAEPGGSDIALAASVFTIPARMFTTLSADERGAWLVWTWLLTAAGWWWRRRRARAATA